MKIATRPYRMTARYLSGAHRRRDTERLGRLMVKMLAEEATILMTATNEEG